MLFPTQRVAEECRSFVQARSVVLGTPTNARLMHLFICPEEVQNNGAPPGSSKSCADLHIVLFRADAFPIAKEFWQHTGLGISSRLAERCLALLPNATPAAIQRSTSPVGAVKGHNRHYSAMKSPVFASDTGGTNSHRATAAEELNPDTVYLEERYGRNLPLEAASLAKRVLRSRVAGVLMDHSHDQPPNEFLVGPSVRGVSSVAADDVFLYPTGMSAIWSAHSISLATRPPAKSVCFG